VEDKCVCKTFPLTKKYGMKVYVCNKEMKSEHQTKLHIDDKAKQKSDLNSEIGFCNIVLYNKLIHTIKTANFPTCSVSELKSLSSKNAWTLKKFKQGNKWDCSSVLSKHFICDLQSKRQVHRDELQVSNTVVMLLSLLLLLLARPYNP
jgi:hypothetical protein